MKKILITGCNGQLGRAIRKEYENDNVEFLNTDVTAGDGVVALDITKIDEVMKMVREAKPDVIINCAAHTAVDLCEEQWDSAYRINAIGPRNLSIAATESGAKMVHVSTDYVFDGMVIAHIQSLTQYVRTVHMEKQSWKGRTSSKILHRSILLSVQHGYTERERTLQKQC